MADSAIGVRGAAGASSTPGPAAAEATAVDRAFAALETYDAGSPRGLLTPLDDAVRACLAHEPKEMERRLRAVLRSQASAVAKEYVCSQLGVIGSADSVRALAELLSDAKLGDAARGALDRLTAPEAGRALRESLARLHSQQKAGAINSLGNRRDRQSVPLLAALLKDAESEIAGAAALALGRIGTTAAARILLGLQPKAAVQSAVAEARLACAEQLRRDGKSGQARALYHSLTDRRWPKHVQLAAKRGLATQQFRSRLNPTGRELASIRTVVGAVRFERTTF